MAAWWWTVGVGAEGISEKVRKSGPETNTKHTMKNMNNGCDPENNTKRLLTGHWLPYACGKIALQIFENPWKILRL